MSLNHLANRFTCSWPWSMATLLCDGRLVCGCADPYGKRVLGDTRISSVREIWAGSTADTLRRGLNLGGSDFCGDCPLKRPLGDDEPAPQRSLDAGLQPNRIFIECTAACNISCLEACCAPETGITRTRQAGMLDFEIFRRVVDETGAALVRIDFFNYGETFLHKRAVEMCEYIKKRFPQIYLYTSTNGLAFKEEAIRRLVHSGIDELTFSIDGASQDTYGRYRQRGRFDVALANMRTMVEEKQASRRDLPFINWRYILFNWNDSDQEMNRARALAAEIGVDRLAWEITDHPEHAFSRRFRPGTPDYEQIREEIWDTSQLGNALPGATPRAKIDVRTLWRGRPIVSRVGQTARVKTRVHNLSARAFPAQATYGRRLVRLGAQLCAEDGTLLDLNHARAFLPSALGPGRQVDITMDVPAPARPGRYQLKFDLVYEGVDWFEACGSETTRHPFLVR